MRVIHLKNPVFATYYKPQDGQVGRPVKVPAGTAFDEETMVQQKFSYRTSIEEILGSPTDPRAGVKIVEMRKALKILDQLEATEEGKPLLLEDEAWSYLDARIQATDWMIVNTAVDRFCEDMHNAPAISKERLEDAAKQTKPTPIKAGLSKKEAVS